MSLPRSSPKRLFHWLSTAAVLGTAACGPITEPSTPAPAPASRASSVTPGFNPLPEGIDWRMEDRFPRDLNFDGVRDENFDPSYLRPSSFNVTLLGCPADAANYTYQWTVNGVPESVARPCSFQKPFEFQGAYDVRLRVTQGTQTAEYQKTVVVKDWFIFSIGDSYGSGEGAPDKTIAETGDGKPRWANERCHRSFNSPSARAALALEESDPRSSVTYVSLACSGATISRQTYKGASTDTFVKAGTCGSSSPCPRQGSGLLDGYVGIVEPETPWGPEDYLAPQVKQMAELVGNRPIDALVISGGGNDIGFADILTLCVLGPGNCDDMSILGSGPKLHAETDPLLAALPGRYDALDARIAELGVPVRNTYLMEYPDLGKNETGGTCFEILTGLGYPGSVYRDELNHLETYVQVPLLNMMRQASARHGWNYVKDIARAFAGQDGSGVGHGMCVPEWLRWINSAQDADEFQGGGRQGTEGKAHPNARGFQVMADHLLASIRATQPGLVPDGTVLRAYGTDPVYIVLGGAKLWVPSWEYLYTNHGLTEADVREVPQSVLEALPNYTWNNILKKYEYLGGASGPLGAMLPSPQGDERASADGQGRERHFANGAIYLRNGQGESAVHGVIYYRYLAMGGVQSWLGWPTSDELGIGNGYVRQHFQGGTVYFSVGTGLILLRTASQQLYEALGSTTSVIGYPTAGGTTYDGGEYTEFGTRALISWHPLLGANVVYGDIYAKYRGLGRWTGLLGLPVSNEEDDPAAGPGGRMSRFLFGTIHWVPGRSWIELGPYASGHRFYPMDYDGDGDKDFVVRGPHGQFMAYRAEAGQLTFAGVLANTTWADRWGWNSGHRFFVMDVDGDKDDDLVARDSDGTFHLLRSDGAHLWSAGFMLQHPGMADRWGWNDGHRYFVMDLDGDRDDDLLARDSAGTFYGLLSNGTQLTGGSVFFAEQGQADWHGWNQGHRYFPMDYDGDGDDDLVMRDAAGSFYGLRSERTHLTGRHLLYVNPGMADQHGWNEGNRYFVMDLDGDRDDDLLARDASGTFHVLKGQGNSLQPTHPVLYSSYTDGWGWNTPNRFFVMDLDKDGDEDLVGRQANGRLLTLRSDRTALADTGYGIETPLVDGPSVPAPPPPPDPCEVDPSSCEPEPDPCELNPASCEPDPCDAQPWLCGPIWE
jgi:hypothetical protein